MLLYSFVSFKDMVKHLQSLHYLYVIHIVKALLKKNPYLKSELFPRDS